MHKPEPNIPSYTVTANEQSVCALANFYIPYEPKKCKGAMQQKVLQLRQDLRNSISNLKIDEHEMLLASYLERNKSNRLYDVENMLFYNIGGDGFRKVAPTQLAFCGDEMQFSNEKTLSSLDADFMYRYQAVNIESVEQMICNKTILAQWNNLDIDESISKSPAIYISAIRKQSDMIKVTDKLYNNVLFGMKIELITSYSSHPATAMKPLLDGIICAFHGEDGDSIHVLRDAFSGQADHLLSDCERLNIFGKHEYIKKYRRSKSFVWSPQDDRLQFAWIIVKKGEKPSMSGTIYKW